ncbi:DUF5602 domain-containing protein [Pontibacter fetidus]|uniref:TTHB210-like domain-containing protein n=1 Tax=Pontibacter fetidus TaxID=2700082 RepID=A0A6B2HA00_9BACT|nr:DUF5602 domain-containing protein [Pontibacter fetidus]NDK57637.1 hypothetical protein [Pontibacter fetidus]
MKKLLLHSQRLVQMMAIAGIALLTSCETTPDVTPDAASATVQNAKGASTTVYYGPEAIAGEGTARVWVETVQGKPTALGIELTEDALANLEMQDMFELTLRLPGQAHATGYKTVSIGWNPMGHEPVGVYTLPHFDFHFYMQTEGQIMHVEGGPDEGAWSLAGTVLPAFYTFGPAPVAVPHMGVHWSDVRSPEFSPAGFSRTFIYGSSGDQVTFLEPMITLAYLQSLPAGTSETLPVPALLQYQQPNYYPETYTVTHSTDGTYSIVLSDLVWHNANR